MEHNTFPRIPKPLVLFSWLIILSSHKTLTTNSLDLIIPPILPPSLIPDLLNFVDQRLALVYPIIQTFKTTITSDPLGVTKTWVGADICSYAGFYCGATPDNASATAIASVDFNGFGLSAPSLDRFLGGLPDLAVFHANSNNFTGTLSPAIAALPYLFELDLSNNNFVGAFPAAILTARGLSFLDVRFNAFAGLVPPQLFTQALDFLFLNDNNLVQTIPESLGSTKAAYVTLANNLFSGQIPRSIGDAADTIVELLLLNNVLSGCLPYELGLLRKAVLIDAESNLLTGPLPCSLKCLEKIEVLNFAGNLLYGKIPEPICELGSLSNFSLSDNYFTSVGPACRKMIKFGILDVKKNCIPGFPDQRLSSECALFFLKPRSCLHPSWFTIVPCEHKPKVSRSPPMRPRIERKLVSYAALSRRRLVIE